MESKKNWAKLFLCILLLGSVEMNVAHAKNHSEDVKKVEVINQKEKINDLDLFIEKKIAEEEKKIESETEKVVEEVKQAERGFVEKYGAGAARAVEIVLLVAILYKLF